VGRGNATVDVVATELGLSRQTLFRRLNAEGVKVQQVLDQSRHKLAPHYLTREHSRCVRNSTVYIGGFFGLCSGNCLSSTASGGTPYVARSSSVVVRSIRDHSSAPVTGLGNLLVPNFW
jgi:AraC-like DNA-binding protein